MTDYPVQVVQHKASGEYVLMLTDEYIDPFPIWSDFVMSADPLDPNDPDGWSVVLIDGDLSVVTVVESAKAIRETLIMLSEL